MQPKIQTKREKKTTYTERFRFRTLPAWLNTCSAEERVSFPVFLIQSVCKEIEKRQKYKMFNISITEFIERCRICYWHDSASFHRCYAEYYFMNNFNLSLLIIYWCHHNMFCMLCDFLYFALLTLVKCLFVFNDWPYTTHRTQELKKKWTEKILEDEKRQHCSCVHELFGKKTQLFYWQ